MLGLILLILLLVMVAGGMPQCGFHELGYGPSGLGAVFLIIVIVLLVTGRL